MNRTRSLLFLIACLLIGCASAPEPVSCSGSFKPINNSKPTAETSKTKAEISKVSCIVEKKHG